MVPAFQACPGPLRAGTAIGPSPPRAPAVLVQVLDGFLGRLQPDGGKQQAADEARTSADERLDDAAMGGPVVGG